MLSDDHILDAAKYVTDADSSPEAREAATRLAYALRLIYDNAVADALVKFAEVLKNQAGIETEVKVVVPESPKLIGRAPWYMRKSSLEKKFRKPDVVAEKDKEDEDTY